MRAWLVGIMLVTPQMTAHAIPDRAALQRFVDERSYIGWQLHGNLRQLMRIDKVGGDRHQRHEAGSLRRYCSLRRLHRRSGFHFHRFHRRHSLQLQCNGWRWTDAIPFEQPPAPGAPAPGDKN